MDPIHRGSNRALTTLALSLPLVLGCSHAQSETASRFGLGVVVVSEVRYAGPPEEQGYPAGYYGAAFQVTLNGEWDAREPSLPTQFHATLVAAHGESLVNPGRLVIVYRVQGGDVEIVDWQSLEEPGSVCIAESKLQQYDISDVGGIIDSEGRRCFDEEYRRGRRD